MKTYCLLSTLVKEHLLNAHIENCFEPNIDLVILTGFVNLIFISCESFLYFFVVVFHNLVFL